MKPRGTTPGDRDYGRRVSSSSSWFRAPINPMGWLVTGALMLLKSGYGDTLRVALTRAVLRVADVAAGSLLAIAISTILLALARQSR
jgi:hypothetical protein